MYRGCGLTTVDLAQGCDGCFLQATVSLHCFITMHSFIFLALWDVVLGINYGSPMLADSNPFTLYIVTGYVQYLYPG
jgi:hypothetical protein